MKKIAQGIVRFRKLILTVAFLLLIPSAIGAVATRINYDILTYLPQDLDSMIGEVALEDDFHLASTGMITVEGLPTNELIAMKKDIEAVPGVMQTFWLSDVLDPSIPTEMLPADVQQFMFGKNDSTMLIVRFDAPSASDETMNAVSQIEKLLRKDCFFGGMSVILQDTKALVNQEMPLYILIAVGASLLVLFLSLESTITPLLFMLGLLFPIAYNFGTNIFLGQISYMLTSLIIMHDHALYCSMFILPGVSMLDYAAFPEQRQALIYQILQENGRVICSELANRLGVSEHTIRRDLHELSKDGVCKKVYGGAVIALPESEDIDVRKSINVAKKSNIAQRCISWQTIFLSQCLVFPVILTGIALCAHGL